MRYELILKVHSTKGNQSIIAEYIAKFDYTGSQNLWQITDFQKDFSKLIRAYKKANMTQNYIELEYTVSCWDSVKKDFSEYNSFVFGGTVTDDSVVLKAGRFNANKFDDIMFYGLVDNLYI